MITQDRQIRKTKRDRFSSARIALDTLTGDRPSQYSSTYSPTNAYITNLKLSGDSENTRKLKPLDTRIQLERTSDRLTFKIPSLGYRPITWIFGVLAGGIYWGLTKFILPYLNTWGIFSQVTLGFAAFVVGLMSLMCALLFVYALIGNVLIEMDRQTFRIAWHLFGLRVGRERGYNSEITRIGIEEIQSDNGSKTTHYAIWRGNTKRRFDSILMEKDEMDWILGELIDFLIEIYK